MNDIIIITGQIIKCRIVTYIIISYYTIRTTNLKV